jgi:hypothetical protein
MSDQATFEQLGLLKIGVDIMDNGSELLYGFFCDACGVSLGVADEQVMPSKWYDTVDPDLDPACRGCFQSMRGLEAGSA